MARGTISEITGHYVEVDGARTFYDEIGAGPPIVCLHTGGGDSRQYQYVLPLLAERGFRAIAPDLPGHARSYPVRWDGLRTIHDLAEFVHSFCTAVCDELPVVVGCSIGGMITLDIAAHHSDDYAGFVPMTAGAVVPTLPSPVEAEYASWCPSWQDQMERGLTVAPNTPAGRREELRWLHRSTAQLIAASDLQAWAACDLRGQLGNVDKPVLLLVGAHDMWVPPELAFLTRDELPRCEVEVLDSVGHYPMFEAPELIAGKIADFASAADAATAR